MDVVLVLRWLFPQNVFEKFISQRMGLEDFETSYGDTSKEDFLFTPF